MMVYICTKFHENILNGNRVMEQTLKVNGWTDRQMDGGHDINTTRLHRPMKNKKSQAYISSSLFQTKFI